MRNKHLIIFNSSLFKARCMVWGILFVCCRFMSKQHLRSYQDGYWLVTVRTPGDFIVLPHWDTRPPDHDLLSHSVILSCTEPTSPCTILIMSSARLRSDEYQFKSLWFDSTRFQICRLKTWTHDLRIPRSPRMGGRRSTHLATPTGLCEE